MILVNKIFGLVPPCRAYVTRMNNCIIKPWQIGDIYVVPRRFYVVPELMEGFNVSIKAFSTLKIRLCLSFLIEERRAGYFLIPSPSSLIAMGSLSLIWIERILFE